MKFKEKKFKEEQTEVFIQEIVELCKKHKLSLSHEDHHGAFEVEDYDDVNIRWLLEANYVGGQNDE